MPERPLPREEVPVPPRSPFWARAMPWLVIYGLLLAIFVFWTA